MSDEETRDSAMPGPQRPTPLARGTWDFTLMMLTVALLAALGAQSLVGTMFVWWAQRSAEGWMQSPAYGEYVAVMNAIAAPLVAGIVIVLGLCVPKRLFDRGTLLAASGAMLAIGALAGLVAGSLQSGLAVYLIAAAVLQAAAAVLTLVREGGVSYLTQGRGRHLGSALLHLGFIVFCLVVVALQSSALMLPVFALSALLLAVGSAMSFYGRG